MFHPLCIYYLILGNGGAKAGGKIHATTPDVNLKEYKADWKVWRAAARGKKFLIKTVNNELIDGFEIFRTCIDEKNKT